MVPIDWQPPDDTPESVPMDEMVTLNVSPPLSSIIHRRETE